MQIWFPRNQSIPDIEEALRKFIIVSLMQADEPTMEKFSHYAFRIRPFHTSIVDLSLDEATLWSKLDKKSTRYEIKKAEKMGVEISVNVELDNAYQLINQFIMTRRYRRPILPKEWKSILEYADVWCGLYNGNVYVVHVLLKDGTNRVRLLMSATRERSSEVKAIVSPLNRAMHWKEILHYKKSGIRLYDFGGIELDRKSPVYTVTQFKLSFGGDIITEYIMHLTSRDALRLLFRFGYFIRSIFHGATKTFHLYLARQP
jgi:hypothetical protein